MTSFTVEGDPLTLAVTVIDTRIEHEGVAFEIRGDCLVRVGDLEPLFNSSGMVELDAPIETLVGQKLRFLSAFGVVATSVHWFTATDTPVGTFVGGPGAFSTHLALGTAVVRRQEAVEE
ncbi:hypothetical protein ACQEVM_37160 [Streptomyces sp. CA-243310]|uniref:hypothetical protein n=1 Tax=Streptomyces sp. CA-243310 TaxID=3240056 RepID=UPI003D8E17E1